KELETSSEETTSDEIAPLSDNTNQTLSNISTSSTNNRAPVRDYLLSTPDGDPEWKMQHILLNIISFNQAHTAVNQTDAIIELLTKMNIGHKLLGVTTDNASNMIAIGYVLKERMHNEFSNINVQHFCCGIHILNIIVKEGIKSVSKEISKAREFSIRLRNSLSLIRELKQIFEIKNQLFLMPQAD
ncbi:25483_t:CDS:2, partial [Racocetra persica]